MSAYAVFLDGPLANQIRTFPQLKPEILTPLFHNTEPSKEIIPDLVRDYNIVKYCLIFIGITGTVGLYSSGCKTDAEALHCLEDWMSLRSLISDE